jgi:hypothetical protein
MTVLGIDPGPTRSAYVLFDGRSITEHGILPNDEILIIITSRETDHLVIEKIASFGMPVGEEVFETVFWTGRFAQRWHGAAARIRRIDIKNHLCHNSRANDTHIRQALIDRFGPGKEKAIGKKAAPGPLFEIHADEWAALAVAVTHYDLIVKEI